MSLGESFAELKRIPNGIQLSTTSMTSGEVTLRADDFELKLSDDDPTYYSLRQILAGDKVDELVSKLITAIVNEPELMAKLVGAVTLAGS